MVLWLLRVLLACLWLRLLFPILLSVLLSALQLVGRPLAHTAGWLLWVLVQHRRHMQAAGGQEL